MLATNTTPIEWQEARILDRARRDTEFKKETLHIQFGTRDIGLKIPGFHRLGMKIPGLCFI